MQHLHILHCFCNWMFQANAQKDILIRLAVLLVLAKLTH